MTANALVQIFVIPGLVVALGAHLARAKTERRAREQYREIVGPASAKQFKVKAI